MKKWFQEKPAYHPTPFFAVFLAALCFLSYLPLSLEAKLFILLFGILIPWGTAAAILLSSPADGDGAEPFQKEFLAVPAWFLALATVAFLFQHFYRLASVPFWLSIDDGTFASYALALNHRWSWTPLIPVNQIEAGYSWVLALFFRFFGVSVWKVRFFPALLIGAATASLYWFARSYFSKSFSFVTVFLFGFSFWISTLSRQCQAPILMLLQECVALGFLGLLLRSSTSNARRKILVVLAFLLGFGFYIFTAWGAFALLVGWATLSVLSGRKSSVLGEAIVFIALVMGVSLPLLLARLHPGGLSHIRSLIGQPAGWDYLVSLFWDERPTFPVGNGWGGILNPIMGSLLFLGLLEFFKFRHHWISRWVFVALPVLLSPGMLSNNVEMYRITPLAPFLAILSAAGVQSLFCAMPSVPRLKTVLALALVSLSAGLDAYHFWGPAQDWNAFIQNKRHWMSVDFSRAYDDIRTEAQKGGRFWMLLNLNNKNSERTLDVAVYDYDETHVEDKPQRTVSRVVLLINSNYESFLKKRFLSSDWKWLSPDLPSDYGGFMIGFIPMAPENEPTLKRWKEADVIFQENDRLYDQYPRSGNLQPVLDDLASHYEAFKGDPFLESVFWAKAAFYEFQKGNVPGTLAALDNALQRGYPVAYLFNEKGVLLAQQGKTKAAERELRKAMACPVNRTSAWDNLQSLEGNAFRP